MIYDKPRATEVHKKVKREEWKEWEGEREERKEGGKYREVQGSR